MKPKEVMLMFMLGVSVILIGMTVVDGLVETGQASETGGALSGETRPSNFVSSTTTPGPAPEGTQHRQHQAQHDEGYVEEFPSATPSPTPTEAIPDFRDNTSDF